MKKHIKPLALLSLIIALLLLNMACSSNDDSNSNTVENPALKVQLTNNSGYSTIMVNQDNQSLYFLLEM